MIKPRPNTARRGTSRNRASAFRPKANRTVLLKNKTPNNDISADILKAKLREAIVVLSGFSLFAAILVGADIVDFMQTGTVDPFMVVITSLMIILVLPIMSGLTWDRRQALKKCLASQAR